ncbi:GyrI-like domain-containing protein [Guptibacillus algicola]|uniref:GyrI-like domain-containing protein n=1 Tax=Guptibacillus algicola TaxID=225844 RepID=UPI001CD68881|nr:GyrI-like domain-containing protein [Alkalihalobacillus algicola]MCA0987218.1 GyrI-like domain-containing protein [Alkalihalobacillus algicola]
MEKTDSVKLKGIEEIDQKKLVGFRVVCNDMTGYGQEIPKASQSLARRKGEIKHVVEPVKLIGAFKAAETSEEDDGYWVCFEVEKYEDIPEGMVTLTVPKEKRAVLQFRGHASEIFKVYSHLHEWIEENGYTRVPEKWTLEMYSSWTEHEDIVDLCDPVR